MKTFLGWISGIDHGYLLHFHHHAEPYVSDRLRIHQVAEDAANPGKPRPAAITAGRAAGPSYGVTAPSALGL